MNAACWVVVVAVAFRLVLAGFTGLGLDESYMVAAAHDFAPSYFDHPLAAWWLEIFARDVTGSAAPIIVRLPFVLLSAVTSWLLYLTTRRLYGEKAAFWAVVAYSISPFFTAFAGSWVLPDGPVDAACAAFLYALVRALGLRGGLPAGLPGAKPAPLWWLAVGLFGGLALLSKYNAALVLAGAGLALLSDPVARRELRGPGPWLAVVLAAALFTPVLWWNATHGWASFNYQGGRAAGVHLRPYMPFYIWAGEALFVLPWLWLPMMALLLGAFRQGPADRAGWLLAWLAIIPVTLFSVMGIWSATHILFHWATPGYLMLFPLLGEWAARQKPLWRNRIAIGSAALLGVAVLAMAAEVSLNVMPTFASLAKPGKSPLLQAADWNSIASEIPPGIDAIGAQRWYDAGKIGYALERSGNHIPVTVFAGEVHEFAYTAPPASFIGKNLLIISMPWSKAQTISFFAHAFKNFRPGPDLHVVLHGTNLLTIPTYIGTDMLFVPLH